jgi:hypothetical protein
MSTRSFIARIKEDGSISGVYCYFDGYPDGVGKILKENYSDSDKVNALLGLGDLSELGPGINEGTIAYARDMKQEYEVNQYYEDVKTMLAEVWYDFGSEYAYVYEGYAWTCYDAKEKTPVEI